MTADSQPFGSFRPSPAVTRVLSASRHSFLQRGSPRKILAKWLRNTVEGPLDVELFGVNARLNIHDNNSELKSALMGKSVVRAEAAFMDRFLKREDAQFVDIGANAGIISLYAASIIPKGRLVAVEPNPVMFARLSGNLKTVNPGFAGKLDLNLLNCAVGAEDCMMELHLGDDLGQSSLVGNANSKKIEVPVRPLMSILAEAGMTRIDFLKIDIEGFEDRALFPFFEAAPAALHPAAIMMEDCHAGRWERDCMALLEQHGYVVDHKSNTNIYMIKQAAP
ncbi:MAG: FkbM family methyltransferase [Hyphomonas sp.]